VNAATILEDMQKKLPIEDKMSHPAACCVALNHLEALGGVIWAKSQCWLFNFDCDYVGQAIKPLKWCPYCGWEWRTQGTVE
jgi:hypothetical protein